MTDLEVHVVDDRSEDLLEMAAILADNGFEVRTHGHGSSIIASVFNAVDPIVILADLHMPDISGWGIVETIASQARWGDDIAFALVTGDLTYDATKKALSYGIHDLVRKPIDPEELIATVGRLANTLGRRDRLRLKPSPSATLRFLLDVFRALDRRLPAEIGSADHFRLLAQVCHDFEKEKPISVSSLCYGSGAPFSSALRRLKLLVRAGLIEKIEDDRDRRRSLLIPTEHGLQISAEITDDVMSEMLAGFEIERR